MSYYFSGNPTWVWCVPLACLGGSSGHLFLWLWLQRVACGAVTLQLVTADTLGATKGDWCMVTSRGFSYGSHLALQCPLAMGGPSVADKDGGCHSLSNETTILTPHQTTLGGCRMGWRVPEAFRQENYSYLPSSIGGRVEGGSTVSH